MTHNNHTIALCAIAHKLFIEREKILEALTEKISKTLKNLRKEKGWSLDAASQKTGVSKAMLGQIERRESSPTIATLWKIASGFDVSFSSFVEEGASSSDCVHRSGTPKQMHDQDDKIRVMPLFQYEEDLKFEVFVIELLPGCEHLSPPHQAGVIEHVIVTEGALEVLVDGQWKPVGTQEGLRFRADQVHGYRNLSDTKATFHDMIHYGKI